MMSQQTGRAAEGAGQGVAIPGAAGQGPSTASRLAPGLALTGIGAVLTMLAGTQPMWLGAQVGPGLFAQVAGLGVIALGALWTLLLGIARPDTGAAGCGPATGVQPAVAGLPRAGPVLLAAVLGFALAVPVLGLVGAAGVAVVLAAWAAGERSPGALMGTVVALMGLVALIGAALLPPTAPLWPWL